MASKLSEQLEKSLHVDLANIGGDWLKALRKIASLLIPPKNTTAKLRVETNISSTTETNNAESPRVDKLPRKQSNPPTTPIKNKATKYGNQHQPHTYNTRSRTNVGVEYTGIPTPKQQIAFHVCTLMYTNIDINYKSNNYEPVINAVYCEINRSENVIPTTCETTRLKINVENFICK